MEKLQKTRCSALNAFDLLDAVYAHFNDDELFESFIETLLLSPKTIDQASAPSDPITALAAAARSDVGTEALVVALAESFAQQKRIRDELGKRGFSKVVFEGYLNILSLDDPSTDNEHVLAQIWSWFGEKTDSATQESLRLVFLEEAVRCGLEIDMPTLKQVRSCVADDALYSEFLRYLSMHESQNIPWYQVFEMLKSIIERGKPGVWEGVELVLKEWRMSLAQTFLDSAATVVASHGAPDAVFAEFADMYLADSEDCFDRMMAMTDDEALVEDLKRLEIGTRGIKSMVR
ncbi:hypothetical protein BDK51DRAFT_43057 [Blyttiomyces helicus]|uniref:Uncharacterized protein n=1 Tax=Blyttiomyces helicus TaxID=388810 RepID=A0A4P9VYK3_9FUNG|nr:hypothetical protein BDK51DRAFT_43057 [Blyttiomyces helicus]|eukprot:RKO84834.1 hypothetical protein BDK51DRAFT_43057 [Blyttiomyces helicus]